MGYIWMEGRVGWFRSFGLFALHFISFIYDSLRRCAVLILYNHPESNY